MPRAVATFTVNGVADSALASSTSKVCKAADGRCTLRAAVAAANNLGTAVVIKLSAADYPISDATAGTMIVTDPAAVTIEGVSAAKTTVSVASGDHIEPFAVSEAAGRGGVLFLQDLTLTGGTGTNGGAVSVASANASAVLSSVDVLSSSASDSGGAIYVEEGHLWLQDSVVRGNKATDDGGGVAVSDGTAVVSGTEIVGNTAGSDVGGLFAVDSTITITGGTVSYNVAGTASSAGIAGGIAALGSEVDLTGTSVDFNKVLDNGEAAGLFVDGGGVSMDGGQLSHNAAGAKGEAGAGILEEATATFTGVAVDSNTGGVGGLLTMGSSAVGSSVDIDGGSLDSNSSIALLGLVESAETPVRIDITGAAIDGNTSTGAALFPCGAICVAAAPGSAALTLTGDTIEKDTTTPTTESAGGVQAVAADGGAVAVELQGDTVDSDSAAGAPDSAGAVLLAGVTDTSASPPVYSYLSATVTGSKFEHDSVGNDGDGGAIGIESSPSSGDTAEVSASLIGDTFEYDTAGVPKGTADTYGGAVAILPTTTGSISDCTFSGNSAKGTEGAGGAVFAETEAPFELNHDTLTGNSAGGAGGGLLFTDGTSSLLQSTVASNTSGDVGGGIFAVDAELNIGGSTVDRNSVTSSTGEGGGVVASGGVTVITNSTIEGNSAGASGLGGGIAFEDGLLTLDSDTITANHAKTGSGLYVDASGQGSTIKDSILSGNTTKALHGTENDCGLSTTGSSIAVASASEGGNVLGSPKCVDALSGRDTVSVSPRLAALAHNGGPTMTMALEAHSPALKIGVACLPTDERGRTRPATACDSGAFELTKA